MNTGNDIRIVAETDTIENSVGTIARMLGGGDSSGNGGTDAAKAQIQGATQNLFASFEANNSDPDTRIFDQFGLAGAVSFTYDDVATNVTIRSTASILAGLTEGNIEISARTINQIESSAWVSLIG